MPPETPTSTSLAYQVRYQVYHVLIRYISSGAQICVLDSRGVVGINLKEPGAKVSLHRTFGFSNEWTQVLVNRF